MGETQTKVLFLEAHFTLGRLMRYLSSVGMLKEVTVNTFAATNITRVLANPGQQAGVRFLLVSLHRVVNLPLQELRRQSQYAETILRSRSLLALTLLDLCFKCYQAFF